MAIKEVNRISVTPRILSTKDVCVLTTLSRPTLWRLEKAGKFPEKVQLSPHRVGYDSIKVENWIAEGCCNIEVTTVSTGDAALPVQQSAGNRLDSVLPKSLRGQK